MDGLCESTERNVTRGNGQKEEETVMSRNDSFLSDILIHPSGPHTNRRRGGMGWGLKRTEETQGKVVERDRD